jgi:hypothetical protein
MKHIFSKIAKIGEEVRAAEPMKVEFALMDDLDKLSNNVKQITLDHRSIVMQFQDAVQKLKTSYQGKVQQSIDLLTAMQNAEKMARDLGVDVNLSKYKTILDEYYKATQDLDEILIKVKTL